MEDANEYLTSDFYIAVFLLAKGHRLAYVNRDDPRRICFAFDDFQGRADLLRSFLFGEAQVGAQAFINAIKSLKQVIHSRD